MLLFREALITVRRPSRMFFILVFYRGVEQPQFVERQTKQMLTGRQSGFFLIAG
jgi:hypothetical protein